MSLRGVDEELTARLKSEAAESGKSVNQLVLELLRRHAGLEKTKRFTRAHDDLDHLFGAWSEEEHDRIQGTIDENRTVDDELWR